MGNLSKGDSVLWRGKYGMALPEETKIVNIRNDKENTELETIQWTEVRKEGRRYIMDLENGHWCYGFQLMPIEINQKRTPDERGS